MILLLDVVRIRVGSIFVRIFTGVRRRIMGIACVGNSRISSIYGSHSRILRVFHNGSSSAGRRGRVIRRVTLDLFTKKKKRKITKMSLFKSSARHKTNANYVNLLYDKVLQDTKQTPIMKI